MTSAWPGELTVITPPHAHEHCDESSSAGAPSIVTAADPGDHDESTGTHGWGTSGPAELAAATCGLASEMQSANGGTLLVVTSLITPAAAVADTSGLAAEKVDGAVPKEHCTAAPVHTCVGIRNPG
jgi:hypothetical protein